VVNFGVFNSGTINGSVTNTVRQVFADRPAQGVGGDEAARNELKDAVVKLAQLVDQHAAKLDDPDTAARRVRSVAEETTAAKPDRSVITRYLDLLAQGLAGVPPVLEAVGHVQSLVQRLFGAE
jgi:hypothetical protein